MDEDLVGTFIAHEDPRKIYIETIYREIFDEIEKEFKKHAILQINHHGQFEDYVLSLLKLGDNSLPLLFNTAEYSASEISDIIALLSELYQSVGGDVLEIKSIDTHTFITTNNPELV
jgi:hypothetical protein